MLDLFSGIGGFTLAAEACGIETVYFVEIDEACQGVLEKNFPDIPCHGDIKTFTRGQVDGCKIDIITGGYPCTPFSNAGRMEAYQDDRDLWPEMFRLVKEIGPTWVVGENVLGHVTLGLDRTLTDLENIGYATSTFIIPACAIGARHERHRIIFLANSQSVRVQELRTTGEQESRALAQETLLDGSSAGSQSGKRTIKPRLDRGLDGVSGWLDGSWEEGIPRIKPHTSTRPARIQQLGNSIVPQLLIPLFWHIAGGGMLE